MRQPLDVPHRMSRTQPLHSQTFAECCTQIIIITKRLHAPKSNGAPEAAAAQPLRLPAGSSPNPLQKYIACIASAGAHEFDAAQLETMFNTAVERNMRHSGRGAIGGPPGDVRALFGFLVCGQAWAAWAILGSPCGGAVPPGSGRVLSSMLPKCFSRISE
jgi:hypothetical protein